MTLEQPKPAQRVMVLYTGGTIGMQASANGLAPASGLRHAWPDNWPSSLSW